MLSKFFETLPVGGFQYLFALTIIHDCVPFREDAGVQTQNLFPLYIVLARHVYHKDVAEDRRLNLRQNYTDLCMIHDPLFSLCKSY